ncbi:hypothetical protein, partial [Pseudomonas sp.]|uniref:hypothetical protein n=1 Tax=Pseudomonas sp. TaxID=306 RepID=UPI0025D98262
SRFPLQILFFGATQFQKTHRKQPSGCFLRFRGLLFDPYANTSKLITNRSARKLRLAQQGFKPVLSSSDVALFR